MLSRSNYIKLSMTLTLLAFALTACSKNGGGDPTTPKQPPFNPALNINGQPGTPGWNGGKPIASQFHPGTTIGNPQAHPVVPRQNLSGNRSGQSGASASSSNSNQSSTSNQSSSNSGIIFLGPGHASAPAKDASGATAAPVAAAASVVAPAAAPQVQPEMQPVAAAAPVVHVPISFDQMPPSRFQAEHTQPRASHLRENVKRAPVIAQHHIAHPPVTFDQMPAHRPGFAAPSLSSNLKYQQIKVTLGGNKVLRDIKIPVPKEPSKKTQCKAPVKHHVTIARKVAMTHRQKASPARRNNGTANPQLVKRLSPLKVFVLSEGDLNPRNKALLGSTFLVIDSLNTNTRSGAVNVENSKYGIRFSEYGESVPQSLYFALSTSHENGMKGNAACDVQEYIGGNEYHAPPCIVLQKDSINGKDREIAYYIYVQRNSNGSVRRIVRANESAVLDSRAVQYDKKYIKEFLAGRPDGLYVISLQ